MFNHSINTLAIKSTKVRCGRIPIRAVPLPRFPRRIRFFCNLGRKGFLHLRVVDVVLNVEEGLAVDDKGFEEIVETVFAVAAFVVLMMAIDVLVEVGKDELRVLEDVETSVDDARFPFPIAAVLQ